VRAIDVRHLGNDRVICCWQVGDVLVDPGPESCVETLLAALGDARPRALLLTHIHLDHAGASGALVRRWPDLEVHVHEVGAPHMADPSKLLASASRLYGEDMDRLWGEVVPVPEQNLRVLTGGEHVDGFRVAHTPGHASHHVCYLHEESGTAFVGDVAGVRIPPASFVVPPTPPPEIDLEAWRSSLDVVAGWEPAALAMTHFGANEGAAAQLEAMRERLAAWGEHARRMDEPTFVERVHAEVLDAADPEAAARYEQAAPAEQLWQGLERYWRKRADAG
jgi:glyoxylase-like metal-dependent hydrolase (beta-lactamase superfamily II)